MWSLFHLIRNIFLSLCFVGLGVFLLWISSFDIPDLKTFEARKITQSTKLYDRTGEILLYDVHQNIKRTVVPLEDISRHIKNATIGIEDAEFYEHRGIKPKSILRAVLANLGALEFNQGGSTITQQVIKNSVLTSEKKLSRKIKEWVLALKLEKELSKEEILALYLNEAPYGGSIYGVEEASQAYFGKSAHDVSLAEAAYLAALPQAPTFYSPYGKNSKELAARKNLVLKKMLENGFITNNEYTEAEKEQVMFHPPAMFGIRAPHFVMYVIDQLKKTYGEPVVEKGGLKIITTLDATLQEAGERIAKKYALQNAATYNAKNVSIVAIDPATGGILAMIGSRDYFDKEIDGNFNVAIAHRQPGSAFKPFVYATAFKKGLTPETVVFDVSTEFSTDCTPEGKPKYEGIDPDVCYMPTNYDETYRGPVSLRNALAQSINIPAIKVLYLSGLKDSLETARDLGITSLVNTGRYGLTLVLGGGEVSLLEMTSAYGVFANDGMRNTHTAILKITTDDGSVLEELKIRPVRVLSEDVARTISSILSDNEARAPAFGAASPLNFPQRSVAAKTGTTNDYRDAWIVGYTTDIAVGAWAGNNDNTPMEKKVAGFIVAPLWHEFMEQAIKNMPEKSFRRPKGVEQSSLKPILKGQWQGGVIYAIDSITEKLATDFTPIETRKEKILQSVHSILHWVNRNDIGGPAPENPQNDFQYESWEYGVRKWAEQNGYKDEDPQHIPSDFDTVHRPEYAPILAVTGIRDRTVPYTLSEKVNVVVDYRITAASSTDLVRADFFLNGLFIGSAHKSPFSYSISLQDRDNLEATNTLRVVGYDTLYNKGDVEAVFSVLQ